MFANLLLRLRNLPPRASEEAFVREVTVVRPIPRNRRSELLLVIGWFLIGIKCWVTFWAVDRYDMPINAWWIVAPTLVAAAVCTWIYRRRN